MSHFKSVIEIWLQMNSWQNDTSFLWRMWTFWDLSDFSKTVSTHVIPYSPITFAHVALCLLSVSELLMGEVDSSTLLSLLPTEKSRVSECVSQTNRFVTLIWKKKNDHACLTHAVSVRSVVTVKEHPTPLPIFSLTPKHNWVMSSRG